MDSDEREIFQFLKSHGSEFIAAMEICRRAGSKRRFHEDPHWAKPVLIRMAERQILESDTQGRYRLKPTRKHKQWVAPEIAKILQEGGVEIGDAADDEYYENL
jgi:hypothetical protein